MRLVVQLQGDELEVLFVCIESGVSARLAGIVSAFKKKLTPVQGPPCTALLAQLW